MKPISRKNVHPILADVRHQKSWGATSRALEKEAKDFFRQKPQESLVIKPRSRGLFTKSAIYTVIGIFIITGAFSGYLWNFKNKAMVSGHSIYDSLKSAVTSLSNLQIDSADSSIKDAQKQLTDLQASVSLFSLVPILKEIPNTIGQVNEVTVKLSNINKNIGHIKLEGVKLLLGKGDSQLLDVLKSIKGDMEFINNSVGDLRNKAFQFGALPAEASQNYLALDTKADRFGSSLDALIELLEKQGATHLLMVFENPSEIRPGGGFVGSYADVILENGSIKSIDVDDIYHPDRFSDLKTVPPKQLQAITTNWGARDANWFFNFPDSAEATINMIQSSSLYEDEGIKFDGVIAVNVRVMEDFLQLIGPIKIDEYNMVLTQDNFLKEVQAEVEAGRDKIPGQNPKKVLKFIMPKVLEGLQELSEGDKSLLINGLAYRLANKDIKFYFKDTRLESIVAELGLSGQVYEAQANWNGDYLAVVDTNIAGGKTDAFVNQKIELASKINSQGVLINNLTVTRSHYGQNEKESWYKQTNQNFIKVFTPLGSKLVALTGSTPKTVKPAINYAKSGYSVDAKLAAIEGTEEVLKEFNAYSYIESGKKVFGSWFNLPAGQTKAMSLTYSGQDKIDVKSGTVFEFVMDKQAGVESKFDYILEAPEGFAWRETGDFIYHYKTDSIRSRLYIKLTLDEI